MGPQGRPVTLRPPPLPEAQDWRLSSARGVAGPSCGVSRPINPFPSGTNRSRAKLPASCSAPPLGGTGRGAGRAAGFAATSRGRVSAHLPQALSGTGGVLSAAGVVLQPWGFSGTGGALSARQGRAPAPVEAGSLSARQGRAPAPVEAGSLSARQGRAPAPVEAGSLSARQGRAPAPVEAGSLSARVGVVLRPWGGSLAPGGSSLGTCRGRAPAPVEAGCLSPCRGHTLPRRGRGVSGLPGSPAAGRPREALTLCPQHSSWRDPRGCSQLCRVPAGWKGLWTPGHAQGQAGRRAFPRPLLSLRAAQRPRGAEAESRSSFPA
ncbi:uncharacterized protein LOC142825116 [Pelodiscus sinensis]|uniref:uncharacterized protein LOC142825116 n=1 Tax=Pelodiscus sinensis TaxID=13735 RepID=UPI003F6A9587